MVVEEIKEKIDELTEEEMREVSIYIQKKQIKNDKELWDSIRENTEDNNPANWVNIKDLQ